MYFHLSNKDTPQVYSLNRPDLFKVYLLKNFNLSGLWECGLINVTFENNFPDASPKNLAICVDICEDSFVQGQTKQILERIPVLDSAVQFVQFSRPCYLKVIKRQFSSVTISVLDQQLDYSKLSGDIHLTLHLKKVKNV